MTYECVCVDTLASYVFTADSAKDAIEKMLYSLNLKKNDTAAVIQETPHGWCLTHQNSTYWVKK